VIAGHENSSFSRQFLNLAVPGDLHGWCLGLEYIVPIDQQLDGPQLETDEQLMIGLQKSF